MAFDLEKIDLGSFGINEEDPRQTQLNANMTEAIKVNPDQHIKTVKLSRESGVPEFAVKSNPEQVENKLKLDQINLEGMTRRAPATSKFLTADINNSVIAQEDVTAGLLEGIEKTFRGMGRSIGIGFEIQAKGAQLSFSDDALNNTYESILAAQSLEPGTFSYVGFGIETDDQLDKEFAATIQETSDRLVGEITTLQKERQSLTPEDMNIVQEGIRAGVESLANMAPAVGLGILSGSAAPVLTAIGTQTFVASYGESRAEGLTPEEARWFASIDAAIEVGTELIPLGTLENMLTGTTKGLKKKALKFIMQEMGTEQLATALQTINSFMFGLDEELENAEGAQEIISIQLRRQAVTAIATIVAGGVQITAVSAVNKTISKLNQTEQEKENQGDIEQRNIDKLNDDSTKSKLKERDVESFKQFVREADGDNNTHVFIDGVQTALYLQGKTGAEIEADPALKTLSNAARDSRVTGTDVAIPVDEFMGDIAGTETYTQLRDSMTMSEETISTFRQEQYKVETDAYVETLMNEARENASEYVEAQEIYTTVRDQLIDTGAVNATNASIMAQIVPAWVTAQARRSGKTVQQVYQDTGLTIEGPQTGELARLEGEQLLSQEPVQTVSEVQSQLIKDFEGLKLSITGTGNNVTLNKIIIPEDQRDQGTGSQVMQRIVDWADQNGKTVTLTPSKDFGGSIPRLKSFYKQLGFVENKGKNKDFEISESMYREPREQFVQEQPDAGVQFAQSPVQGDEVQVQVGGEPQIKGEYPSLAELSAYNVTPPKKTVKAYKLFRTKKSEPGKIFPLFVNANQSVPVGVWVDAEIGPTTDKAGKKIMVKSKLGPLAFRPGWHAGDKPVATHIGGKSSKEVKVPEFRPESQVWAEVEMPADKDWQSIAEERADRNKKGEIIPRTAHITDGLPSGGFYTYKTNSNMTGSWLISGEMVVTKILSNEEVIQANLGGVQDLPRLEGDTVDIDAYKKVEAEQKFRSGQFAQEQPDTGEARGYYDPANSVIRLTESSDLSTFLHEFAHFMYEMEARGNTDMNESINNWYKRNAKEVAAEAEKYLNGEFDVLKQGERTTEAKQEVTEADVVNYLDTGSSGSTDKDSAIRRAVHEQFARGFETYLMEGKAPSIELRNAFRTFARWLGQIYKLMRGSLNVNLDAEMRQVFDRLLATDDQIAAAESRARIEPMFTDAVMAGMTDEEFTDYQKRQEKVKDIQTETLRDKLIKTITNKTKKWWKEEKADLIDEELDTLSKERVYVTTARLRAGDLKLDHATVKEMIGEVREDKLGRKSTRISDKLRGMTAKGQKGVHPDEAAAFFGYNSGSEMLTNLVTAPPIKETAEVNAESRMVERHGDVFTDGTIEQQADEAVQNEERGKLILHELKILARGTNQRTLDRQTMKSIAAERIGQLSFRENHPGKYRKAEINAAQESARMLAEGNKEGSAQAKARQALNYYLGMAATEAKNETTKIVDGMARYSKKKVREEIQKAQGGYWDQIVKILERFEFRKSATLASVDRVNQDINTWSQERMNIEGDGLVLANVVLNEVYSTHWKNVAYSDLQGINDSVKNIEHVARYSNKLTRMGEEIEFNKLVNRWVDSMNEKVKTRFQSKRTDVVEGKKWGRWLMAQMTKIPFMASWLDGGERTGISHQVLVQPFTDAYDAEIKLWEESGKPVMDAIEGLSKETLKRYNRKIFIPEIDDHLFGNQIITVALNTGNAGNLRKLLLGEKWANPDIDAEINLQNPKLQAVLSHMTESDWNLVQMIWDQMNTLYPKLSEVHRQTTGLVPPKVEATPVKTPFGTFAGGYYPVKYDPNRSHRAAQNEDRLNSETESMFSNGASIQASVNASSTSERTGFYDAIRLSLDVVPAHFQETIHYITHHEPVREVNKLTRDQRVAQTIKEKLGPEEYAQLKPWLNDIAKDGREAPTKMFWDDILQRLRFGVTLGAMGFKASTGIIQISGLSNTIAEVGLANTSQALRTILNSETTIKQAWDFAVENSKVMEHRAQTMDREIKSAMKQLEGKRGLLAAAQEASMKHIALIQTYMVDLPSWHASYIKGMNDWGDETRAFQYADWVIENVQGSGATKDLARIMRGQSETGRMFTMFMTFFSSLWNMERDLVKGAKSGRYSTTNVAAKAMFLFTTPVLFEMLMRGELGEDDDDENALLQTMLTKVAMYPVQSIPFIRDIANAVTGDFGYNISPMQSIIEQGTRTIPQLITRGFTDEEITKGQVKGASKFIGAATGIPGTGQAWATGEHLYDVITEGEEFTMHQFLFGPERN